MVAAVITVIERHAPMSKKSQIAIVVAVLACPVTIGPKGLETGMADAAAIRHAPDVPNCKEMFGDIEGPIGAGGGPRFDYCMMRKNNPYDGKPPVGAMLEGELRIGAFLPRRGISYYPVPPEYGVPPRYRYAAVETCFRVFCNWHHVLADPETRQIVDILN
jgi:hypothetical protein